MEAVYYACEAGRKWAQILRLNRIPQKLIEPAKIKMVFEYDLVSDF